jgi:hypothetical protein
MLFVLVIGGGLLGVSLGIVAREGYESRSWPESKQLGLLIAVLPTAGLIGLFLPLPRYGSRLPLCVYLVSLLTGYIVTAMMEAVPGVDEHPVEPPRPLRGPAPTFRSMPLRARWPLSGAGTPGYRAETPSTSRYA